MKSLSNLILSTLILGICSSPVFAAEHKVDIKGMAFSPAELTVEVGDTVVFTNQDAAPHTGTATDNSFTTGILNKGQSGTVEITKSGVIDYFCEVHPSMKGKVTAEAGGGESDDKEPEESGSNDY